MCLTVLSLCQKNIVGRNIPVNNPAVVNLLQCLQHRDNNVHGSLLCELLFPLHVGGQCFPFQILHDNVCCVVRFEAVIDMYDSVKAAQLCQLFCLLKEFFHPSSKLLHLFFIVVDHHIRLMQRTGGKFTGQILLNGHLALELLVIPDVRYAKAAKAQSVSDQVAVYEYSTCIDMQQFFFTAVLLITAIGTYIILCVIKLHALHTLLAAFHFQSLLLKCICVTACYHLLKLLSDIVIPL